jgi:hypothetical protein
VLSSPRPALPARAAPGGLRGDFGGLEHRELATIKRLGCPGRPRCPAGAHAARGIDDRGDLGVSEHPQLSTITARRGEPQPAAITYPDRLRLIPPRFLVLRAVWCSF